MRPCHAKHSVVQCKEWLSFSLTFYYSCCTREQVIKIEVCQELSMLFASIIMSNLVILYFFSDSAYYLDVQVPRSITFKLFTPYLARTLVINDFSICSILLLTV